MRASCATSSASRSARLLAIRAFGVGSSPEDLRASSSRFNLIHSPSLRRSRLTGVLLRRGDVRRADARIGIEAPGASAFHRELGGLAAAGVGSMLSGARSSVHAGMAGVDPFHARITTIVVHDLRDTAPVGRASAGLPFELLSVTGEV